LFIGTDGLDISDKERPALDVLDAILSGIGYPTGRLEDALRGGDLDLVYLVHAFPSYGINAGFFGVITQTTMGNMEKVQNIILQNLRRMSEQPVSQQELEMGKNMLATMHHMEMESLGAQAQNAAVNEVLGLGWDYDERYLEQVKTVTVEDVQNIAKKLFAHTLIVRTIPENPVEIITPTTPERHIHPATP
ncbi:MAG TPA: insulinase family protein, partial [Bacillota bacterium]|nr:insulinase family protein [Bacillota bacterium]